VLELVKAALMSGLGLGLLAAAAWLLKIEEASAAWRWTSNFLRHRFSRADVPS
jgi:hypothetical protein